LFAYRTSPAIAGYDHAGFSFSFMLLAAQQLARARDAPKVPRLQVFTDYPKLITHKKKENGCVPRTVTKGLPTVLRAAWLNPLGSAPSQVWGTGESERAALLLVALSW
jgi:hypothetical protein